MDRTNFIASIRAFCQLVMLVLASVQSFGQPSNGSDLTAKRNLFDLFSGNERPDLVLVANFDSIKSNIRNKNYVQGSFEVTQGKNQRTALKVKLRPRGKSRRMMCDFPPLKLKFDKENLEANGLLPFNDFKLVTHCMEGEASGEAVIRREYLVYKLYSVITQYCFKANLVNITYKNTGSSFNKSKHLGIIIEDAECLAHRNNCKVLSSNVINLDSLHRQQEKIASVFQYMIGNADWSYLMARNMELIKSTEGIYIPVPYDFDYSGLVAAPYARANATLGQTTVLDRVFLGNSKSYDELSEVFEYFKSKKGEVLATIDGYGEISNAERVNMIAYINGFYDIIASQDKVEKVMFGNAKKE